MTKQEYRTVKTLVKACTVMVLIGDKAIAYADVDQLFALMGQIWDEDLKCNPEPRLSFITKKESDPGTGSGLVS